MGAFMLELNGSPFYVTSPFEAFYLVIEISNYVDVVLMFLSEYHDEDKDVYVRDIQKIFNNYLKNGLVLDLLASIPFFSILVNASSLSPKVPAKGYNWLYIVYLMKTLRSHKAARILRPKFVSDLVKDSYEAARN